ncbi:hypothetical protein HR12_12825 [Microbacterium sp. SUBG005]|nr:hypothetical protein HR12_12825 [Microbacterium sp. SUBG005]
MTRRPPALALRGATALLAALLVTGCVPETLSAAGPDPSSTAVASPTGTPEAAAPPTTSTSATAVASEITVYAQPGGSAIETLPNPQESGAPLTFLVAARQGEWLQVLLARRPNGSMGWVTADSVALQTLVYRLDVSTGDNTLTLSRNGQPVKTYPVATGTGGTPTPQGSFYLTELIQPTNDGYGPYAFGVSAFSEVLSSFGGGPGQIGMHGTDDEASIGQSVSHGCIRLSNADITELAQLLPLGTPLTIGP